MGAITLTIDAAREVLGCRRPAAVAWLRDRSLIVTTPGGPRVIEGDLLAMLRAEASPRSADRPAPARREAPAVQAASDVGRAKRPAPIVFGEVRATVAKKRGVLQREDGAWFWRARMTAGAERRCIWSGWATRDAALQAIKAAVVTTDRREAQPWLAPANAAMTVGELVRAFVDMRESTRAVRATTLRQQEFLSRGIIKRIGSLKVVDLTTGTLRAYAEKRCGEASAGATSNELDLLFMALRWAAETERVCSDLRVPQKPRLRVKPARPSRAPKVSTLRGLLAKLDETKPRWAAALRFQLLTGARPGEAWALRRCDVRVGEDGLWATLRGKTGERTIPIVAEAVALIEAQPESGERVFGRRASQKSFVAGLGTALLGVDLDKIGVERVRPDDPHMRPNDARAFYVQQLYAAGVSPHVASLLAGHSPATAMAHYLSARPEDTRRAVAGLNLGALLEAPQIIPLRAGKGE